MIKTKRIVITKVSNRFKINKNYNACDFLTTHYLGCYDAFGLTCCNKVGNHRVCLSLKQE